MKSRSAKAIQNAAQEIAEMAVEDIVFLDVFEMYGDDFSMEDVHEIHRLATRATVKIDKVV